MKKNETFAQFASTLLPGATTSRNMSTLMSSECALKNHFTIKLSRPKNRNIIYFHSCRYNLSIENGGCDPKAKKPRSKSHSAKTEPPPLPWNTGTAVLGAKDPQWQFTNQRSHGHQNPDRSLMLQQNQITRPAPNRLQPPGLTIFPSSNVGESGEDKNRGFLSNERVHLVTDFVNLVCQMCFHETYGVQSFLRHLKNEHGQDGVEACPICEDPEIQDLEAHISGNNQNHQPLKTRLEEPLLCGLPKIEQRSLS